MAYLFEQYVNLWLSATAQGLTGLTLINPRYIVSIRALEPKRSDDHRIDVYEIVDVHGTKHILNSIRVPKGEHARYYLTDNLKELSITSRSIGDSSND